MADVSAASPAGEDVISGPLEAEALVIDIVTSPDGTIEAVSPSVAPVLGYLSDQLVGSLLFRYVNEQELVSLLRTVGAVVGDREKEARLGVRLRGADGLWHLFQARVRARLNGAVIVGVALTLQPLLTALID